MAASLFCARTGTRRWKWSAAIAIACAAPLVCSSPVFSSDGPTRDGATAPEAEDATLDPVHVELGGHEDAASDADAGEAATPDSIAESLRQSFKLHGHLRQETAYRVEQSGEFTKLRGQALVGETGRLTDQLAFRATQRIYYDPVYDLTDNYDERVERDQGFEAEVRDTYLDYSNGPLDVRLGNQQIVWGETVGLFVADIVNAKDFREYVLPDFDLIRIPQWGVDVEWAGDPFHAEFVWLPVLAFNHLPVSGAEFEFPLPVPAGFATNFTDPSKPPSSFNNGEVGTRLSYLIGGWDLSGYYLYSWDKSPVLFRRISGGTYIFSPEYRRAHYVGASFSKEIHGAVLKGEGTLNPQSYLTTFDARDPDGIVHRPVFDYVLGVDYTFFDHVDTNVQLLQRVVFDHPDLLQEDELRTHISFWAKTDLLDGKVEPEFLVIAGINEVDLLYRPKVTVKATDSFHVAFGADIFQGHVSGSGLFGKFDDKSRIYTELTYYF